MKANNAVHKTSKSLWPHSVYAFTLLGFRSSFVLTSYLVAWLDRYVLIIPINRYQPLIKASSNAAFCKNRRRLLFFQNLGARHCIDAPESLIMYVHTNRVGRKKDNKRTYFKLCLGFP